MIDRIEGELAAVNGSKALLRIGPVVVELLIPVVDEMKLSALVGGRVEFHTIVLLDSPNQGATFIPRMIGFGSPQERAFFELFTTVKGIGPKKALRALAAPFGMIAGAIAEKDVGMLVSLPEIGRRTAETIVAELSSKVDAFIEMKPHAVAAPGTTEGTSGGRKATIIRDALAVLVQLGENRITARELIDKALAEEESIDTAELLVSAAYRMRA